MNICTTYVALHQNGDAEPLPVNDTFWPDLVAGKLGKFERMISAYRFDQDWDTWERHPAGDEFVSLMEGEVELLVEDGGKMERIVLDTPGAFALVPRNAWHTAKVRKPSFMLFVTQGEGTENRPV